MQTNLAEFVKSRDEHDELESILRSCVHCGFCNATCPTYQITGNELDGPRGRIYLLKQMLEGESIGKTTQRHLDRCLSCRACETTCPSGVEYGRLLDLGRPIVEDKVKRPKVDIITRFLLLNIFPFRQRFKWFIKLARLVKPVFPIKLRDKIPVQQTTTESWPQKDHPRKVLLLSGCVQDIIAPSIDISAARVLDKLGITLVKVKSAGCCGALPYHLSEHEKARLMARNNIDACWPAFEQGIEGIMMTASGCGVTLKDYHKILMYDPDYAKKAERFSALVKDISEIIKEEDLSTIKAENTKIAFQSPCTLQHGQKLAGIVESILIRLGYQLTETKNQHLCCGSAGVYSILQAELSEQLRENKINDLNVEQADYIATANIGCLNHLQEKSSLPVIHWIELLDKHTI